MLAARQKRSLHALGVLAAFAGAVALGAPSWPVDGDGQPTRGYVVVVGTVAPDGSVAAVRVHRSQPPGAFDAVALEAAKQWRFEPRVVNGQPVAYQFSRLVPFDPSPSATLEGALAQDTKSRSDDLIPIHRQEPQFPREALIEGISGWVIVRGVVKTDGTTRDVWVERSSPPGMFDSVTLRALKKWTFKPRTIDGVTVERDFTQRIDYNLVQGASPRDTMLRKLIETRRDELSALYDRGRGLCSDLYPHADDAVNLALQTAERNRGVPDLVLHEDPHFAVWHLQMLGECVFSSWEQFRDPAAWSIIAELAPVIDAGITAEQREALKAHAAGKAQTPLPLVARSWVLAQVWDGYFELLFAHGKQFSSAPATGKATQDALDAANAQLERRRVERALKILRDAYAGAASAQDRAQLALTIARIEAARGQRPAAIQILREVVDAPDLPWNLRQAVRLALARFSGEQGDATTFDAMLAAVNAELAVGDRLAF